MTWLRQKLTWKAPLETVNYNRQTKKRSYIWDIVHDFPLVAENVAKHISASKEACADNYRVERCKKH